MSRTIRGGGGSDGGARTEPRPLPLPDPGAESAARWVASELRDLAGDAAAPSPRFRGGQRAADAALSRFDVRGYAGRRNEVWPRERRGASGLSPYIRHGLLLLQRVWEHVEGGPGRDVAKFRDELLWQEYARHLYARVGRLSAMPLRFEPREVPSHDRDPWPREMACMAAVLDELEGDGWIVNQTRMWMASQWTVRSGAPWRDGEEHFFRHLLDGSRAANRLGWQWTVGAATGRAYAFTRWQVEKRAPALCANCPLEASCPIEARPAEPALQTTASRAPEIGPVSEPQTGAGPMAASIRESAELVWLTAESLGLHDPALRANPRAPAAFVFDAPRLARWRLSAKRLVFLVETLAELALDRPLELWLGRPEEALAGRRLAATYTPVPGWQRIASVLEPVEVHPWPWLRRPHRRALASFSQWRKEIRSAG